MRRTIAVAAGLVLGTVVALVALATTGSSADGGALAPWIGDPDVPSMAEDLGVGESLYLVVGGTFPSREAAEAAGEEHEFGDLQGFYAVPVGQFRGLSTALGSDPAGWALLSAFRTLAGAGGFEVLARSAGAEPNILGPFESLGGLYAGLGQEAHPDGAGPLQGPLPTAAAGAAP